MILNKWPCVRASLEFIGVRDRDDLSRRDNFQAEISHLFDRFQEAYSGLARAEKDRCGLGGVAADVSLKIDMEKHEVILGRLYKYCAMHFHLFTEILQILRCNFSDYILIVPSLQGFELAKEILRFLGKPKIECVYLKGDCLERLLPGKSLPKSAFLDILEYTKSHYETKRDAKTGMQILDSGLEISMYYRGTEGEEEVLWMNVAIPLSYNR